MSKAQVTPIHGKGGDIGEFLPNWTVEELAVSVDNSTVRRICVHFDPLKHLGKKLSLIVASSEESSGGYQYLVVRRLGIDVGRTGDVTISDMVHRYSSANHTGGFCLSKSSSSEIFNAESVSDTTINDSVFDQSAGVIRVQSRWNLAPALAGRAWIIKPA